MACCLMKYGQLSPAQMIKLGTGAKTPSILQDNHYGWFNRVSRGVYVLNECAHGFLNEFPELVQHYTDMLSENQGYYAKDSQLLKDT